MKRSAFSVFKTKESSPGPVDDNGTGETPKKKIKQKKRRESLPSFLDTTLDEEKSVVLTPNASKPPKPVRKSEPKLSAAIRQSFKKKSKKEHHELPLKSNSGRSNENRLLSSSFDWTDSSKKKKLKPRRSLEETFLPDLAKLGDDQNGSINGDVYGGVYVGGSYDGNDTLTERMKSVGIYTPSDQSKKSSESNPLKTSRSDGEIPCDKPSDKPTDIRPRCQTAPSKHSDTTNSNQDQRKSQTLSYQSSTDSMKSTGNVESSSKLFEWLIGPIKSDKFFNDVWEKKPLFIKRRQPKYNSGWFSTKELDVILRERHLEYTKNIDIAVYKDQQRQTLNPEGRCYAPNIWKFYEEGCSIRLKNPQTFSKNVWKFSSKLQEYFGCFVGSNVYLTPPGSQGFAPHYDDIEAFIIQLEGRKHWRLYNSRSLNEVLPRTSSENLPQEELGEPILDRILEPGDTLYFPKGVIHQAVTSGDTHSLHITLSVYQNTSWADFMEKLLPRALELAVEEDVEFRRGLPLDYLNHVGVIHSEQTSKERSSFLKTIEQLMKKLVAYLPVDAAADQMAVDTIDELLPPALTDDEKDCSIFGNGSFWNNSSVNGKAELQIDSEVRLIRPGIARMIYEEDKIVIFHSVENSRQYKERPAQAMELSLDEAEAAEMVMNCFPDYVAVSSLPFEEDTEKIQFVSRLYHHGLLRTKIPLRQDSAI